MSFEHLHFSVWRAGKKIADHTGDVLFTHLGLSGPGILDASGTYGPVTRSGSRLRGASGAGSLQLIWQNVSEENRTWQLSTLLAAYRIPETLNRKLLALSGHSR